MSEVKDCLTCKWEPNWFEEIDVFNSCPHCNIQTMGICKKLALIVPILGQPCSWPDSLMNSYSWLEKVGDEIYRSKDKKRDAFRVVDCPAHQPKAHDPA